jgi:hypothetical protein
MLLLLALLPPALATDHTVEVAVVVDTCPDCDKQAAAVCDPGCEPEERSGVQVTLAGSALVAAAGLNSHVLLDLEDRRAWFTADGRIAGNAYMARAAAGVDIFPSRAFDLRVGLFAGHAAEWQNAENMYLLVGTDIGVGMEIGRTWGQVRVLGGESLVSDRTRSEVIWTMGYRILDRLSATGEIAFLHNEDSDIRGGGVGLGLAATF